MLEASTAYPLVLRAYSVPVLIAAMLLFSAGSGNAEPNVSSTQSDSFADTNSDGRADPGEQIDYDTVILNSGATDAEGVTFTNSVPADTTLNSGSLK